MTYNVHDYRWLLSSHVYKRLEVISLAILNRLWQGCLDAGHCAHQRSLAAREACVYNLLWATGMPPHMLAEMNV